MTQLEDSKKAARTIKDLLEYVDQHQGPRLPDSTTILQESEIRSLTKSLGLVDKYQDIDTISNLPGKEMNRDMCILSALNINNAKCAGLFVGRAKALAEALKLSKSKIHIICKEQKELAQTEGGRVSITDKDIQHVTRIKTSGISEALQKEEVLATYTNHVYFAVRDFVETTQRAIGKRIDSEAKYGHAY